MRPKKVTHLFDVGLGAKHGENAVEQLASFPLPPNLRL
jgi:hypothetical protein